MKTSRYWDDWKVSAIARSVASALCDERKDQKAIEDLLYDAQSYRFPKWIWTELSLRLLKKAHDPMDFTSAERGEFLCAIRFDIEARFPRPRGQ